MLSTVQDRVEKSLFEVIRKILVAEGYVPDIADTGRFPAPFNSTAQSNWDSDLADIKEDKGFPVEVYGASASQAKGNKKVPRIAMLSRRTLPGDIGAPLNGIYVPSPSNPLQVSKISLPYGSSNFQFDFHIVSNTAAQDRIMNAVLSKAIGMFRWLPYYDDPTQKFFARQYNYYDLPDPLEGITEKVYSFECPDVFENTQEVLPVALINEITIPMTILGGNAILDAQGNIIGPFTNDDGLFINLDTVLFDIP